MKKNDQFEKNYSSLIIIYKKMIDVLYEREKINGSYLTRAANSIMRIVINNKSDDIIRMVTIGIERTAGRVSHAVNSTILAGMCGYHLNYNEPDLHRLIECGLLHDIGMFFIDREILEKDTPLTDEEIALIRKHPLKSYRIAKESGCVTEDVLDGIIQHHEQVDGNGYPRKLKIDKIVEYAKILSIADNYEAQITPKKYRDAYSAHIAMKSMLSSAQTRYDPEILKKFMSIVTIYPIGTAVILNDGTIGKVKSINHGKPLRPVIENDEGMLIDLKDKIDLYIKGTV